MQPRDVRPMVYVNPMQQAMLKAAEGVGFTGPIVKKVAKAADRISLKPMREDVKVSFRTAQKLRAQGVLA